MGIRATILAEASSRMFMRKNKLEEQARWLRRLSMTQPAVSALAPGSFICGDTFGHLFFLPNMPLVASARVVARISATATWSTRDNDDDSGSEIDNEN